MQLFLFLVRFKEVNIFKALDNTTKIAFNLSVLSSFWKCMSCDYSDNSNI